MVGCGDNGEDATGGNSDTSDNTDTENTEGTSEDSDTASSDNAEESTYPPESLEFLVAAGAGGGTDNFSRTVQSMMEEEYDTTITVTNLPTSSGALAHKRTANGDADGTTLDFSSTTMITSLAAGQNPTGLDQVTPVARFQSDIMTLIVNPDKYENFDEFYEYAQNNKVTIGGTHASSPDAMANYSLKEAAGLNMEFIPYDEEGSVSSNILSGNIDGMFGEISSAQGYIESGEMVPILIFAEERLEDFPDIPTTADYGWDLTNGNERGVFVSADTPEEKVNEIEKTLKTIYDSEAYQEYAEKNYLDYREGWLGSEEYAKKLENDVELYKGLLENQ
ncbi:tripartite tricarboxylate transporter substrate binding protein [Salibacterium salarium]|uniref:Tripartite tricarboxylate transporter substrate binding protein n=2 Tax=Salibacterium salarium TaxID=284579 RepID=A0A428N1L3_9BACI|nr:tripartite tricarboxylate transporter substrate binding protein [Salibacterium salarium]